ncbi:NHL repeat-containing protein [Adhaeretor mobilis]|uniref:Serine/threonine-protein kinase PknD n=1 Tax=Adhaeretor mobilis TaxID=1930276 RepID=A0A517MU10_9BACT|nr:NHL repeat-containing protein [Adhaeretor mobilis]QDS98373.1 Serine/threonine-protein kinase PknD [Adhaeretor mobilis]
MNSKCPTGPASQSKRSCAIWALALVIVGLGGCIQSEREPGTGRVEAVWGKQGISAGDLQKPRAAAIDSAGNLYLVDMTARIQVYDPEGNFLRGWKTPASINGRPSGLSFDHQGRLLVADTHYFQVLKYTPDGELLEEQTLGGTKGEAHGEFGFVTDAVEDSQGNLYVGEYGTNDRIQKFSPEGEFLLQWGGHGEEMGQFRRPQNLTVQIGTPEGDRIWVVDACNHRVQAFDTKGELLTSWGTEGSKPGELYYPYDLVLDDEGNLYICEYGNHRVQKFTPEGKSLGIWGTHGRESGQLNNPWALALDQKGRLFVVDSNNHRVQRIRF